MVYTSSDSIVYTSGAQIPTKYLPSWYLDAWALIARVTKRHP